MEKKKGEARLGSADLPFFQALSKDFPSSNVSKHLPGSKTAHSFPINSGCCVLRFPYLLRRQKLLPNQPPCIKERPLKIRHAWKVWVGLSPFIRIQSEINQNQKAFSDCFHCWLTHGFQFSLYPLSFPLCISVALHRALHKGRTQYRLTAYQNGTFWHFRTTRSACIKCPKLLWEIQQLSPWPQ